MTLEIRPRDPKDLGALAEILVRVHAIDGYPVEGVADPLAWLTPPRQIAAWTALLDGCPVGQAALTQADTKDDVARVWHEHTGQAIVDLAIPVRLFIDPVGRNYGAASHLLQEIRTYARHLDLELAFDVMLKDAAAIRLYEALGCVRIGTLDHVHGTGQVEPAAVYIVPAL